MAGRVSLSTQALRLGGYAVASVTAYEWLAHALAALPSSAPQAYAWLAANEVAFRGGLPTGMTVSVLVASLACAMALALAIRNPNFKSYGTAGIAVSVGAVAGLIVATSIQLIAFLGGDPAVVSFLFVVLAIVLATMCMRERPGQTLVSLALIATGLTLFMESPGVFATSVDATLWMTGRAAAIPIGVSMGVCASIVLSRLASPVLAVPIASD